MFSIKYGKYFSQFYSLEQYYQDSEFPPSDAYDVKLYGIKLEEVFGRMGLKPQHWTSPASILHECAFDGLEFPSVWHNEYRIRRESVNYALHCCHRLWISNYKVGYWPEGAIHDYDLASAFPSEAMQLYDTRPDNCKYTKSESYVPDADWGYLYGDITINKDYSPIMRANDNGDLQNPIGRWRDYITLDEVNFIEKHKLGTFKLIDGWFLKFKNREPIFDGVLQKLYAYRGKHFLTDALAKRMMNSLYGLTIQKFRDGQSGKFYNPFYAANITARCRLKVGEFILSNELQDNMVSVTVDGCLAAKRVPDSNLGTGMGKWKYAGDDATIVISPGLIFRASKKPKGINYQVLKDLIEARPNAHIYTAELPKRVTMSEALRLDFNQIGKTQNFGSTIDLESAQTKQDRVFREFPKTGKELLAGQYTSSPVVV